MCRGEEKEEMIKAAMEKAKEWEHNPGTIWTDSSRLDSGGVGVGIARYEEVSDGALPGPILVSRRGVVKAGERRERGGHTYHDGHRSFRGARSGWGMAGFGMGGGHEAYDAELAAIVYGLIHLWSRRITQMSYTIFMDPTATMARAASDALGLG